MGIVEMKHKCHEVFDAYWQSKIRCNDLQHIRKVRKLAYHRLRQEMRKEKVQDCHFSRMNDIEDLQKAYEIILTWK